MIQFDETISFVLAVTGGTTQQSFVAPRLVMVTGLHSSMSLISTVTDSAQLQVALTSSALFLDKVISNLYLQVNAFTAVGFFEASRATFIPLRLRLAANQSLFIKLTAGTGTVAGQVIVQWHPI